MPAHGCACVSRAGAPELAGVLAGLPRNGGVLADVPWPADVHAEIIAAARAASARRMACTQLVGPVQAAPDKGSCLVKLGPAGDC